MNFGLSASDWGLVRTLIIEKLQAAGCDVWVFGSRARGTHREFSDLDICFSAKSQLPTGLLSEIKEATEDSNIPVKVEIGPWEDLADDYRQNIVRDRKLVAVVP